MGVLYLEVIEQMNSAKGLSYKYKLYAFAEKNIHLYYNDNLKDPACKRNFGFLCIYTFTDEAWELGGMLRFSF